MDKGVNALAVSDIQGGAMNRRQAVRCLLSASSVALAAGRSGAVSADTYPSRPIKLIVPYPAGGVVDVYARKIGDKLTKALGQPLVVENRVGASGIIGVGMAAKARPDGYTLAIGTSSNLAVSPALGVKLPYDVVRDFEPVTQFTRTSLLLVAHPSLGAKTARNLVDLAKSSAVPLAYGSGGATGIGHLAAELFQHEAGIRLLHVPYKTPPVLAVLGNEVPLCFDFAITAGPHVRSNKLNGILATGRNRIASLPNVPTARESGYPGAEIYGWGGFLVPSGTPREIVNRLHKAIVGTLREPDIKAAFDQEGAEAVGNSPEEFRSFIISEQARFARIIKMAGIKPEEG